MNKLTKNKIWFNLEKIICLTVASAFLILMIVCITSCSTTYQANKVTMDKKTGIYHQKNTYEPWSVK